jgi:hypothetical protein
LRQLETDLALFAQLQPNDEEVISALRDMAPQAERPSPGGAPPLNVPIAASQPPETPRAAELRVALVVGISAYQNIAPLTNPVNDARLVAQPLQSLG